MSVLVHRYVPERRALMKPGEQRVPDFLIAGAMKSGTTALSRMLNQHPDIYLPPRELHYFDWRYDNGDTWYLDHFRNKPHLCVGEKTPRYMARPTAMEHIAHLLPDVRLVLVLRDPVKRFLSHFEHENRKRAPKQKRNIEAFWDSRVGHDARWRGKYDAQLSYIFALFPRNRVHIVISEELRHNTAAALARIQRFIGVLVMPPRKRVTKPDRSPKGNRWVNRLTQIYRPHNLNLYKMIKDPLILRWTGMNGDSPS